MPITIFFCYSRKDEALLNKLKIHLMPLQQVGLINVWYDRNVSAGTEWKKQITQYLNTAQIILLLVSPDFMASEYCHSIEMKRALERYERGEAKVIPIILRHAFWHVEPLVKLQALPTDGKPVTDPDWFSLDKAFYNVTQGIYNVVKQLVAQDASVLPIVAEAKLSPQNAHAESTPISVQERRNTTSFIAPLAAEKLTLLRTLTGHRRGVLSVAISADGQTLVSGSWDNTINVWDLSAGKEIRTLSNHTNYVLSVALSADGGTLVSGSWDATIKVCDLVSGKEVRTLSDHTNYVLCVAFCVDGETLVSGSSDGIIKVWKLSTGKKVCSFTGHRSGVWCIAISADRQTMVSGSLDQTIKVWDLSTGQEVRTLIGHTMPVLSVAISPDGETLVSGSSDKTIKLWKLSTGKEIRTLTGHTDIVNSVVISPDGQTLVSGSWDNTINVWGV